MRGIFIIFLDFKSLFFYMFWSSCALLFPFKGMLSNVSALDHEMPVGLLKESM